MAAGRLLPNGEIAKTDAEYFDYWQKIANRLSDVFGLVCYGFDPNFGISQMDGKPCKAFDLPTNVALKLLEVYDNKQEL